MLLPLLSLALSLPAAGERFEAPFRVSDANGPIDVEVGHAAPLFVDFDDDGLPDLLVGQFGEGKLRIYKNVGARGAPRFESFTWFKTGEQEGKVPAGWCVGFGPQFADLDGDGQLDILSGSYSPGDMFVFRGLGKGQYAPAAKLLGSDGKPARAGLASALAVADWDGDGDLDLLVGNIQGEVWLLPNEGKKNGLPIFGARQSLGVSHTADGPSGDAGPCVVDWDGDRVLDLLAGDNDGSVHFYKGAIEQGRHVLHKQALFLEGARQLSGYKPVEGSLNTKTGVYEPQVTRSQERAKPCACDWNGDGKLDLVVGDFVSLSGPEPVLTAAEKEERKRLEKEYVEISGEFSKAYERILAKLGGNRGGGEDSIDQAENNTRISKLLSEDAEYTEISKRQVKVWERLKQLKAPYQTHGYVWVYVAK